MNKYYKKIETEETEINIKESKINPKTKTGKEIIRILEKIFIKTNNIITEIIIFITKIIIIIFESIILEIKEIIDKNNK
ncbi:MAG TPA: hypothetical protein PK993_03860 [Clostridia bacterium]|nr:hypothetical protein [Clostridia bacterium]